MTNQQTIVNGSGAGLPAMLFVLFLGLKLAGITWSWWWVFAPLWVPAVVIVLILLAAVAVALLGGKL